MNYVTSYSKEKHNNVTRPLMNITIWQHPSWISVISWILDLTLIGMSVLIMMLSLCFYILGWRTHCIWTRWFVLYIGCKPIIDDICICLFLLGVEPEAHDWRDVLCLERRFGTHEKIIGFVGNKPWILPCWRWA